LENILTEAGKLSLIKIYENWAGEKPEIFIPLPKSGSAREYYRLKSSSKTAIGVFNADEKENIAFLTLSHLFKDKNLNVPKIYGEDIKNNVYLEEDLGDETLFSFIVGERDKKGFSKSIVDLYKKAIEELIRFQVEGIKGLDISICYPREEFDKQSMMWDLNYFKYYFLKLANIPFDEQLLENDYHTFADYLLQTETNFFLYRDFQSRNIMIKDGEVYFIDYQGGRKGALQYDVASLLFDAKADIPHNIRAELLEYYITRLKTQFDVDDVSFRQYFFGYVLIRILQAMGAYGYRGFYEKKEHFLKSIPYALDNLNWLLTNLFFPVDISYLTNILRKTIESDSLAKYRFKSTQSNLVVSINSFSYKRGIPKDNSEHGGGFVFDCRAIHNPGRYEPYKLLTGKDPEVIEFLTAKSDVNDFLIDVYSIVDRTVDTYIQRKFTNLMINFGCTGGQHRSVFCAESLSKHLKEKYNIKIELKHIQLEKLS